MFTELAVQRELVWTVLIEDAVGVVTIDRQRARTRPLEQDVAIDVDAAAGQRDLAACQLCQVDGIAGLAVEDRLAQAAGAAVETVRDDERAGRVRRRRACIGNTQDCREARGNRIQWQRACE